MTIEQYNPSSFSQHLLPVTSDQLIKKLTYWQIKYKYFEHIPLMTVKESKSVQNLFLSENEGGGHIKNLFLRDHKKNYLLLVAHQDALINLKSLQNNINVGRLSFGSKESLFKMLGVFPGAVSPFAMINGVKNNIPIFIDKNLQFYTKLYAHPLVNDRTLEITVQELELFFRKINVVPNWIEI